MRIVRIPFVSLIQLEKKNNVKNNTDIIFLSLTIIIVHVNNK